ncbi:MAG TPA: 5-dehydro-4-deoxy-D-glucuronate isomerase [Opitutales bacterium]|jgi:4-deoxy-L-threo-5-hexosulose-uronate ketol-isomerase|nr:5-dehydro-4-deoxy-D-glucuronate isomerase [Opitutales bacterium]
MEIIRTHSPEGFKQLDTAALRRDFLVAGLFTPGAITMHYWEVDRTIIGGAAPLTTALELTATKELLAANFFCERREVGIVNLGGLGSVVADGVTHQLNKLDALYVGRGTKSVKFISKDAAKPAQFYFVSYPAHTTYPAKLVPLAQAQVLELGATETANRRKLCKLIVPGLVDTCQLVLGVTLLENGSVWNTMPCHTHERRSEVYLYFDVPAKAFVTHYLGRPTETRHLIVRDREAALSPSWSIHSGSGTCAYGFVWCMGGENQEFTDMDAVAMEDLR